MQWVLLPAHTPTLGARIAVPGTSCDGLNAPSALRTSQPSHRPCALPTVGRRAGAACVQGELEVRRGSSGSVLGTRGLKAPSLMRPRRSDASRRNVGSGDFLNDKAILPSALVARPPALPLLVVALVAPETEGFVSSNGQSRS
jgi:hypothetical protein